MGLLTDNCTLYTYKGQGKKRFMFGLYTSLTLRENYYAVITAQTGTINVAL